MRKREMETIQIYYLNSSAGTENSPYFYRICALFA